MSLLGAAFERLGRLQARRPLLVIALCFLSLLPTGFLTSRLGLKTSFSELLPDTKPSVIEGRRVEHRLSTNSTLTIVAESGDVTALEHFVDALVPRLRALDPSLVSSVDWGTREAERFFERHRALYAPLDEVREIRDRVVSVYDARVQKAAGMDLGLDPDEPGDFELPGMEAKLEKKSHAAKKLESGVDGYYVGDVHGKLAAILVRTPLANFDPRAAELRARVERAIADTQPQRFDPGMRIGYTGDLITGAEAEHAVVRDLVHVGSWGVALVLAVVFLYFQRVRVLLGMGSTILIGCTWAFAAADLGVGYLNTATGFLVSIIAGNGINFGIIYMARYIEARRDGRLSVPDAIALAHRETHTATLAVALAAMVAYGSLSLTDFRGSRHFGLIGGAGMLLCWLATYLYLPAFLAVSERLRPMFRREPGWRERLRGAYAIPFDALSRRAPRAVSVIGIASGVGALVFAARFWSHDPIDYDLSHIQNDRSSPSSTVALSVRVDQIVGRFGQDGRAILTERLDQVAPLVAELGRRRAAAPPGAKPFQRVVSIFDFLPEDQDKKLALVGEIADRLERAKKHGFVSESEYQKARADIPSDLSPIGIDDLPEVVARPFTEKDGTRGRIVYIVPSEGRSVYDAHYLAEWADSFRRVELPNGDVILGTGEPVIVSDMLDGIRHDAPRAILLSFLGTLCVIGLAFRGRGAGWLALFSLIVGLGWLSAYLWLDGIRLNFLNFIALPISIGVGADYALNIMKRYALAGSGQLGRVVLETGGAVVVCSLTTTLGYLVLMLSVNGAVRSFGHVAAAGEIATLLSAVLLLPSLLRWRESQRPHARDRGTLGR